MKFFFFLILFILGVLGEEDKKIEHKDVKTQYLSYSQQVQLLKQVRADNPLYAWIDHIGPSYEKQKMWMITFGVPSSVGYKKPLLFINCGLHAREWIASAACMNIIYKLGYENQHRNYLHRIDIAILPNANPDGYEFTRKNGSFKGTDDDIDVHRMWRKNRRPSFSESKDENPLKKGSSKSTRKCFGVDLNRNFPFKFDYENKEANIGRTKDECSRMYAGPYALSEFETRNVYHAIQANKKQMRGFADIHAFGQLIIRPYAYEFNVENDKLNDLRRVGTKLRESMGKYNQTEYTIAGQTEMYPATGFLVDSVFSLGVKYSYSIELPPIKKYGTFDLPVDQIDDISDGLFKGIMALAQEIINEYPVEKEKI